VASVPDPLLSAQSISGAIIMIAGAVGVAAWSYIKARLIPELKDKTGATLVGGVIGGNELRLIVESLSRLEGTGAKTNAALDDCKQSTDDVERAVRDHAASAARDASNAAQALMETHKEARRAADLVDKMMRDRQPAPMPPGRWVRDPDA
jgi:hypothetical protein